MKIMFIVGSLSGGGAERVVSELASSFAETEHEVYVVLIASIEKTYYLSDKVHVLDCSKSYNIPGIGFAKRVSALGRIITRYRPDVVLSFTVAVNLYSVMGCIGRKTRLVLAERNDPRFDPVSKFSRIARCILYPLADHYVFQTQGERVFFSKRIQRKSSVIPNPVNPDMPAPFTGSRRPVFVMAGRLEPQKNPQMAIDAFKIVKENYPDYSLEIYGSGKLNEALEKYVEEQDLTQNVIFKGVSNRLYDEIKDSFAFLLSSNYEGISNSMLEAMALGLPVISTDYPSGGARENIEDGVNGFLVPVGCVDRMAQKMMALIEDPKLWYSVAQESLFIRDTLSIDRIKEQWIDCLEKLLIE